MKRLKKRKKKSGLPLLRWGGAAPVMVLGVICICLVMLFAVSGMAANLAESGMRSALGVGGAPGGGIMALLPDELSHLGSPDDELVAAWLAMGGMYDERVYNNRGGGSSLPDVLYFPDDPTEQQPAQPTQPATQAEQIQWSVREGELPIQNISISPAWTQGANGSVHVNNSTDYDINVDSLMAEPLGLAPSADGPQVLIVHTHTTESYTEEGIMSYAPGEDKRSLDPALNVVAVGDVFERELASAGIGVIHDTTVNDDPSYNGSYTRMKAIIEDYLAKYPSIRCVLDIHRDSMITDEGVKYKPVATIDGRQTAQLMLVSGTDLGGLDHPDWRENLKFALHIQKAAEEAYPGLMRPINFRDERFNQHLTHGSLILEVGSSGNTLSEALLCAQYGARAIAEVLNGCP